MIYRALQLLEFRQNTHTIIHNFTQVPFDYLLILWVKIALKRLVVFAEENFEMDTRMREMYLNACCTCSTIVFPHSTNHITD